MRWSTCRTPAHLGTFCCFVQQKAFFLSLHPVADIVSDGDPGSCSLLVEAGRDEDEALGPLVPHSSAEVVIPLVIWLPGLTLRRGVKGGVEDVQIEDWESSPICCGVLGIGEEQTTAESVAQGEPLGGHVDVAEGLVSDLLARGEAHTGHQHQQHPHLGPMADSPC